MPGFFEIKSGDWTVKAMYASLALALVGGVLTLKDSISGTTGGGGTFSERAFMCLDCKHSETMSIEDFLALQDQANQEMLQQLQSTDPQRAEFFRKLIEEPDAMIEMEAALPSWGDPRTPLTCPQCSKKTYLSAQQCKECDTIFIPYDAQWKYNDKCTNTDCGYSPMEERRQQKADERKKKQEKRKNN